MKEPVSHMIEEDDFLETASEIKFKTLFLDKFPIKYRNFSKGLLVNKVINLGITEVDFGFEKIPAVQIKLLEFPKFKMIEFRKRDFKVSIGIVNEGTILLRSNDLFEYEIQKNIKNNRLKIILDFFSKLFSGTSIKFHLNNVVCDLDFINHIEKLKFNNILEQLSNFENIIKAYNLYKNKEFSNVSNSFYALSLLNVSLYNKSIDTWINLKIKNKKGLCSGDRLILKRLYKFDFKNFPFDLVEIIEIKKALTEKEITANFITLNRKTVKISFEKIKR